MDKHLHIVTLDTPWPVNYGGVVDLFYKLQALYKQGIQIHLHCFSKDAVAQPELNKYCVEVTYYKRNTGLKGFSLSLPYIVNSRKSKTLLQNLNNDNYPILLEGIHCTYHLFKNHFAGRQVFVRLHNTEFAYYNYLAKYETNILKKWYFLHESKLLKKYESIIAIKANLIAVSEQDVVIYKKEFNAKNIYFLPVFVEHNFIASKDGVGSYCLYQGNLSVNENEKAVSWLLQNVFGKTTVSFIIAGKNPSKKLVRQAQLFTNVKLIANPTDAALNDLISNAQINILPSFNNTGVKLKLINALFIGRHCLTNTAGVVGSGLEELCYTCNTGDEFLKRIEELISVPIIKNDIECRTQILQQLYNNEANALKLLEIISSI